ncbi:MAG: GNAT family N-acetyltransferase [Silvibacterium sp.]
MFVNPVRHALQTRQRRFAEYAGDACKYASEVAPFAAVGKRDAEASRQLHSLLATGEIVYMMGQPPLEVAGLVLQDTLAGLQMVFPEDAEVLATGNSAVEILTLSCADAAEMVELTTLAFPGYFRMRTCEMGSYYGVRVDGRLVSMAGERFAFDRYVEISGVCTHPEYTGNGYAAALIARLLLDHRRDGWLSCLHLNAANKRARDLYERLGFRVNREVSFHRMLKDE